MKALQTQFDDKRLSNAVATPTCSSCCCCCCCLATSIASSTLLAKRISKEGEKHQIPDRRILTILAALFIPMIGAIVYFGFWMINLFWKKCNIYKYNTPDYFGDNHYTFCTTPGAKFIFPLLITAPFIILLYLYIRVHIKKPLKRALMVTALTELAFIVEMISIAFIVFTLKYLGIILYLAMVPSVIRSITIWYHKSIGKEVSDSTLAVSKQDIEKTTNLYDEESTNTEKLP
jgi:uncharacterized membrane protein